MKDLFDYDLVEECSKTGKISLKITFQRHSTSMNDWQSECKSRRNQKQKAYQKKK